jgi:hypothetical protein
MSKPQPFSYESFRRILSEVHSSGYQFCRFDSPGDSGCKEFYLRHDVDISPNCALRLGRIATEMGVHSNFFFQLNADTYNPFSPATLAIIADLRSAGHCVGLHIDENLVGSDEEKVRHTLRWFSECCVPSDNAVSFHRPSAAVLGHDFAGFASGYGSRVWGEDRYLSDSRRSWDFYSRLHEWLSAGRKPIQLLLHPEWWHPHPTASAIWEDLRARRENELASYMVLNFNKVFSSVITPEERAIGL